MSDSRKGFARHVGKKMIMMLAWLALLLFSLTAVFYGGFRYNRSVGILSRGFEEQRLLVQGLSRVAGSKYAALQAIEKAGSGGEEQKALIGFIDEELAAQYRRYSEAANAFKEGFLLFEGQKHPVKARLASHDALMASTVRESETFLGLVLEAMSDGGASRLMPVMEPIQAGARSLTQGYEELEGILVRESAKRMTAVVVISAVLFLLAAAALIMTAVRLKRAVLLPLDVVYGELGQGGGTAPPAVKGLMPVVTEIREELEKRNKLVELVSSLSNNTSFYEVLHYIYSTFSVFIPYNHIGIALLKNRGTVIEASYAMSDEILSTLPKKLLGIRARISVTSLEDVINAGTPRVINDLEGYLEDKPARTYNQIILEEGIKSSITLPLKVSNQPVGVIFFSSVTKNIYAGGHVRFLETLADSIAVCFSQNIFIDELLISGLTALAKLAESRDENTGNHLERMKEYSRAIAGFLSEDNCYPDTITADFIRDINYFSPMHDIGKVGVRDEILLKPGKLTEEEYEEMKKHALFGAEVLRTAESNIERRNRSMFRMGIEIAESHHEKWDGSGYPYGKSGESIPLSARIVAVSDVLDALTSERPYKRAYSFEEALDIIIGGSGKHFDPVIIESVIRHRNELYELCLLFQGEAAPIGTQ